MARGTFNVRFSNQELARVKLEAKARGMSTGRYIRFRVLGPELKQEARITELETKLRDLSK